MMCSNEPQKSTLNVDFLIRLVLCRAQDYEFLIISPVCTLNSECIAKEQLQKRRTLDPVQFLSGDFEEETSPQVSLRSSSVEMGIMVHTV